MIPVLKSTQKRINPLAPYTTENGAVFSSIPSELIEYVDEPAPPVGYNPDTWVKMPIDDYPYFTYEEKPAAVILQHKMVDYERLLDNHLDSVAKKDRWDNRINFAVRAGYNNPWRQKAIAFGEWMDSCNALAYQLLAQVTAGEVPLPTEEEFIAMLPVFDYVEPEQI